MQIEEDYLIGILLPVRFMILPAQKPNKLYFFPDTQIIKYMKLKCPVVPIMQEVQSGLHQNIRCLE